MNKEIVEKLIKKVGTDVSGRWMSVMDVEKLIELTVRECIESIDQTPTHCAYTSYDLSIVKCTLEKSIDKLHMDFELKKHHSKDFDYDSIR